MPAAPVDGWCAPPARRRRRLAPPGLRTRRRARLPRRAPCAPRSARRYVARSSTSLPSSLCSPLVRQRGQCRRGGFHVPCPPAVTQEFPDCHGPVTAVRRSCRSVSACGFVLDVGGLHLVLAHETEHVPRKNRYLRAPGRRWAGRRPSL